MSAPGRTGRWAALAAEAGGSLLLVLALFWLFMLFLHALFPSGTPLKELIQSRLQPVSARPPVKRQAEATLRSLLRDVRFRRGNSIAWGGASEGMQLYSQDAVQTFDRSGATISFGGSEQLRVGSNSLVVVTRLDRGLEPGPASYRVQVDGELRGSLSAGSRLRLEFSAAGHLARILPGAARFALARNGDDGASLAVYAGEARVLGQGRVVRVPANFGVTIRKGRAVGAAVPLPAPPLLAQPEQALYRYRLLPPRVSFAWSAPAGAYHLQLSTDAGFHRCLIDRRLATPGFVTGELGEGSYFWRVSRVEQGREGAFSRVGRCRLLQVLTPPELQVSFPPKRAPAGPCALSGRSEPGSRIFVNGIEVAQRAPGGFAQEVLLKPGVNLIRVEALDPAGNASYASRMVYAGPEPQGKDQAAR